MKSACERLVRFVAGLERNLRHRLLTELEAMGRSLHAKATHVLLDGFAHHAAKNAMKVKRRKVSDAGQFIQVKGVVHDAGQRTGMPVVTERWIGGTLTNFSVIRARLKRLEYLEGIDERVAEEQKLTKKELASIARVSSASRGRKRSADSKRAMDGSAAARACIKSSSGRSSATTKLKTGERSDSSATRRW